MNLIDTNAVNHIFQNNLECSETYYMAPEVNYEVDMAKTILSKQLPQQIIHISSCKYFDELIYLDFYNQMLNCKSGRSFFNMTGFGDISILATIHTLLKTFNMQHQKNLFDTLDAINVITNDHGLVTRIKTEFAVNNINCVGIEFLDKN